MTDDQDLDWLSNPAPPPRSMDPAMTRPANTAQPVAKPKGRGRANLRPVDALAREMDEAPIAGEPDPGTSAPPPQDPPEEDRPPPRRGGGERPWGEIWHDCPVKALGINGKVQYFLDIHGQLQGETKIEASNIARMFGNRHHLLFERYPVYAKGAKKPTPKRFDAQRCSLDMVAACADRGLFDPDGAVRGVGAWTDDDGQLVYHLGDRVLIGDKVQDPCAHQGRMYPAFPPIPHPALRVGTADPWRALYEAAETWHWRRPEIDPFLFCGTFGVQAFGGALGWRPAVWITGGPGTGKSAIQRLLLHLHGGDKGLIQSPDATARGIASFLGQSSRPVALDELEPGDTGSDREKAILETARVASSGGNWVRGSSDQKGSSGKLMSTFMFSSVLIPGVLKSQDYQRIMIMSLDPFATGSKPPDMRADSWRKRGAELKRIIIDRWGEFADRQLLFRDALYEKGITSSRDLDNYGTTLAMAHLMQSADTPTAEELAGWADKIANQVKEDLDEVGSDADEVLMHLLTQPYDIFRRGEQFTVGQWIMVAARSRGAPENLLNDFGTDAQAQEQRADAANAKLSKALIKVIRDARNPEGSRLFIGSAKANTLLNLFRDTQWAGGAWTQSLSRVRGAKSGRDVTSRTLAGVSTRGVEIPLKSIPALAAFPQDRDRSNPSDLRGPDPAQDWV